MGRTSVSSSMATYLMLKLALWHKRVGLNLLHAGWHLTLSAAVLAVAWL